jgi:Holliday junction resolvase RusA-like endonuclease
VTATAEITSIGFVIPGPLQAWQRPVTRRSWKGARTFTPPETLKAEAQVGWLARQAMGVLGPVLDRPVRLSVDVEMAQPKTLTRAERAAIDAGTKLPTKTPDIDNLLKTVLDGLNGVAFRDDAQVCEIRATKRYALAAQTTVTIEVIGAVGGGEWR